MKNIKLLKPQPSPKNAREPLANITNCFTSKPKSEKQIHRSPSHSPVSTSRLSHFDKQYKKVQMAMPKFPLQAKYMHNGLRCINHKQKQGKFKIEFDFNPYYYCQGCAVQLNQKGKKLVLVKKQEFNMKMISQAKKYLNSVEEIMAKLNCKFSEMKVQKFKLDSKYDGLKEDIEAQRQNIINKINQQYDCELNKLAQNKQKEFLKIEQYQQQLRKYQYDFKTIKQDVSSNLNEINHIQTSQFREIMNIYWQKMALINEKLIKTEYNPILDSTQYFVNKYLPPSPSNSSKIRKETFDEKIKKLQPNHLAEKEFTFSKNNNVKCKEVYSWEQSGENVESVESIVQQKIKIK